MLRAHDGRARGGQVAEGDPLERSVAPHGLCQTRRDRSLAGQSTMLSTPNLTHTAAPDTLYELVGTHLPGPAHVGA